MSEMYGKIGKRCAIYIRVSSEKQVEGFSLDGQKNYLKNYAEQEGMTVVETYVEEGKSGKSTEGRDEFKQMLRDAEELKFDYVLVFKLSRFARNVTELLNSLNHLQSYNVNLIAKEDGIDSSTSMGKMMMTILGAIAEMEGENISVQSMLGREEKARQGGWNGGLPPYGYTLVNGEIEIVEEEAEIVKKIFNKFVEDGKGYSTIAKDLNKQGIHRKPHKSSKNTQFTDWSSTIIKRMLANPIYTGRIAFGRVKKEKVVGKEKKYKKVRKDEYLLSAEKGHEAIISDEIFEKARLRMAVPPTRGNLNVGKERKHLLTGILKCPMCNSRMHSDCSKWETSTGEERRTYYYKCSHSTVAVGGQCSKNKIKAEWVEAEVVKYTKLLVTNKQFAEDIQKSIEQKVDISEVNNELDNYKNRLKVLERNKANLEKDIDNIAYDDKNGQRKRKDMNKRLDKIYNDINEFEQRINDCEQKKISIEKCKLTTDSVYKILLAFDDLYDKMNEDERRDFVQSIVSEIHLHPKEKWEEGKNPIKSITYAFPISDEVLDEVRAKASSIETIAKIKRVGK